MYRLVSLLLRLLRRERADIGRPGEPLYLTRWTLLGRRFEGNSRVFLHCFHRSDRDDLHNHPWPFWSLILWPGYWEVTPGGRKWYGPLSLLRRPATWAHRVELGTTAGAPGRCWTLVWAGKKVQSWGFFCAHGFTPWRVHAAREAVGLPGCGEPEMPATGVENE